MGSSLSPPLAAVVHENVDEGDEESEEGEHGEGVAAARVTRVTRRPTDLPAAQGCLSFSSSI